MITLTNVRKEYNSDVAIGPVNLEIPAGGITALVGPNGAGKSTLLTMIGRLLAIDSGAVTVAQHDISKTKSKDLAKVISILRQENHFVTKLTVRQLVGFGRFPYTQGRLNAEDEEIITKYIDFLHLTELENRYLDQLSGGQRQRAYVAMVLCQETDYVLLDEPLNNLDIAHSVQMMQHLQEAAQKFGRTIIVVLHDINFAARYADYICAVKDGQISAFGTPEEVLQSDLLTDIFNTEVKVIDGPDGLLAVYH
ncbi:ATP-binding cassette domain-containing protein [Corynebacterium breve]|uniref:ATP-binding cassette domain-containing protein n=1 Tax=Corynebacterium breve TaxID=3049799 RepID=A0ABY8VJD5_9CORY|nr:ATP-binding cassette domain-containing protein [Corynebacterium breve]WIM68343.1 ATP-binding cassette domain-containing protein [Corynebacterium breve]